MLETNLASLELDNPVLSASGTFGSGWEGRQFSDLGMVGGLVSKTVTLKPRHGNPPPRIFETASGMLNAIGLENKGCDAFLRDTLPRMHELRASGSRDGRRGPRVIVNLGGSTDELTEMAKRFCAAGVDALEINLSCPNVAHGTSSSTDPVLTEQVIAAVKAVATVPVFAKLTPNITDVVPIAAAAQRCGADAVTLINTLVGMAVDWRRKKPVLGNTTGGLLVPPSSRSRCASSTKSDKPCPICRSSQSAAHTPLSVSWSSSVPAPTRCSLARRCLATRP